MSSRYVVLPLLAVSLIGLWLYLDTGTSYACSCVPPRPPLEAWERADAVFSGEIIEITGGRNEPLTVELSVHAVWKGPLHDRMLVATHWSSATCGYGFVEGKRYIVYTSEGANVSLCSRTKLLSGAEEDIEALGGGYPPTPGSRSPDPEPDEPGNGGCNILPGAVQRHVDVSGLLLMVGLAWFTLRRS